GMVTTRANNQAEDGLALTRRAIDYAKESTPNYGRAPEVTVTGHSLGGALAQISAHHYDLRGETFNAYGAASLNRRIPEGGGRVMNHVMASDVVSAGSPHYGQVSIYAKPEEISRLQRFGFNNDNGGLRDAMGRSATGAAARSLSAHSMHLFTDKDANGKPDVSVLHDPAARQLADDNAAMIGKYRGDVQATRRVLSFGLGGPYTNAHDALDAIRGPAPAGEPGRQESLRRGRAPGAPDVSPHTDPFISNDEAEKVRRILKHGYPGARGSASQKQASLEQDPNAYLDRMLAAAHNGDDQGFRAMTQSAALSGSAIQMRQEAVASVDRQEQEQQTAQLALQAQQQQEQQQAMQAPRMRL
ncbi:MAG: lipase, partial [Pseudomonadota bacterium]|nr:lipase [Pseudomonadota bacterium]